MENTETKGGIEIDLKHLLLVIWHRLWLIILAGLVCAGVAFAYAWFFVTPTYQSSAQFYVNNQVPDSPGFSASQIDAARDQASTYMVILESRNGLSEVANETELGYSYEKLRSMVTAKALEDTEVFEVTVTCTNYKHAAAIANAIAKVLPDKIHSVVDGSAVKVVDYAVEDARPVGPNYRNYLLLGFLVGGILSAVLVLFLEVTDTTIYTEEYLTQVYGKIPLLVVIPGTGSSKNGYAKYRGYYKGNYESAQKKAPPKTPEQRNGGAK